jgi:alpha-ketoglutarate-dependent taurine dioxygenase
MNNLSTKTLPVSYTLERMMPVDFIKYYRDNILQIEEILCDMGAVKFNGVVIDSLATFQLIVEGISDKFLNYVDGTSPRTKLSTNVYTSTEFDKRRRITMHNELSYSAKWPGKLFFSCLTPAETGGETLLADSRDILQAMDASIVSEVEKRGISYVRNLENGAGMSASWQSTFETSDKSVVEAYCRSYSIDFEWYDDDNLRLRQFTKGIVHHRRTGERVWFNQIDQFHPSHLGKEVYDAMLSIYDSPSQFPMYVTFGDGKEISPDMIAEILSTIDKLIVAPAWEKDQLLIVDNELVSHGRSPFTGDRKVLVSMSE